MTLPAIETIPPKTLSARGGHDPSLAPAAPCCPVGRLLHASLALCERLAQCVAAIENTWGAIIGSEPLLVAWGLLQGLVQAGRARTYSAATASEAAPPCLRFTWRPVRGNVYASQ